MNHSWCFFASLLKQFSIVRKKCTSLENNKIMIKLFTLGIKLLFQICILQNIFFHAQQKTDIHTGLVNVDRIFISGWTTALTHQAILTMKCLPQYDKYTSYPFVHSIFLRLSAGRIHLRFIHLQPITVILTLANFIHLNVMITFV